MALLATAACHIDEHALGESVTPPDGGRRDAGGCIPGYVDLDGDPANGCECVLSTPSDEQCNGVDDDCDGAVDEDFDLDTDVEHCGACEDPCDLPGAVEACVGGECRIDRCLAGLDDCNDDPSDGCESDVTEDPDNCGACGEVCSLPGAVAGCVASACVLEACLPGRDDCDGDPDNGCERDVSADVASCGACDLACDLPGVRTHVCVEGACGVGACRANFGDCDGDPDNGCEADLRSDADACGSCGATCEIDHASATCVRRSCEIGDCDPGFDDCDGMPSTGCETAIGSDRDNCGGCGVDCGYGVACAAGRCEAIECSFLCFCPEGDACNFDCTSASGCVGRCRDGGSCTFACEGGGCDIRCDPGSSCALDCPGGDCSVDCRAGAECSIGRCADCTCSGAGTCS